MEEATIKSISEVAASLSLIVAVITFLYSVYQTKKKKTEETIENWQRVAIYKAIADGNAAEGHPVSFEQLKRSYYDAAFGYLDVDIPKEKIQDSSLLLGLMSLIQGNLIELLEDGKYRLVFTSSWEQLKKELDLIELTERRLREKIRILLNKEPGKYDRADLWVELKENETTREHYFYIMQKMIASNEIVNTGGTLSLSLSQAPNPKMAPVVNPAPEANLAPEPARG
jgi:hypothetical protein